MEIKTLNDSFIIDKTQEIDRSILKSDFVRYTPPSIANINNSNVPISITVPREDDIKIWNDAYLDLEILLEKNAGGRYADNDLITLVNNGPLALFSEMSIKMGSLKEIETVSSLHIATLMYKMLTNVEENLAEYFVKDDGIDWIAAVPNADATAHVAGNITDKTIALNKRRNRIINENPDKGVLFISIPLKDVFGFFEDNNKVTYSLGFQLILKTASTKDNAIYRQIGDVAKITINDIGLNVRRIIPSLDGSSYINDLVLDKSNIFSYSFMSRRVFSTQVNSNSRWRFNLGVEAGMNIPSFIIVGFQSAAKSVPDQTVNNGVFDRLEIISTECSIGSHRYPNPSWTIDFGRNKYLEPYNEIKKFLREYVGEQSYPPYITFNDFRDRYNLWIFDLRAQSNHIDSQKIEILFDFNAGFDAVTPTYTAYALMLSNKVISVTTDGQRQFDIL